MTTRTNDPFGSDQYELTINPSLFHDLQHEVSNKSYDELSEALLGLLGPELGGLSVLLSDPFYLDL